MVRQRSATPLPPVRIRVSPPTNEATQQGCFFRSLGAPPSHRIGLCAPFGRSRIRFATFAPRAVRNSGYISPDLDGREKYLTKILYFSFWERAESGSHSPLVRRGELCSPAGVQRTPLRSKNGLTKILLISCYSPQSML